MMIGVRNIFLVKVASFWHYSSLTNYSSLIIVGYSP